MSLLFGNFQQCSGDISENGEKVVDSCMQISFIACGYPPPFYYFQEGCEYPFETFQPGIETLLKTFACSLHY
jgi:hypothetical protein